MRMCPWCDSYNTTLVEVFIENLINRFNIYDESWVIFVLTGKIHIFQFNVSLANLKPFT